MTRNTGLTELFQETKQEEQQQTLAEEAGERNLISRVHMLFKTTSFQQKVMRHTKKQEITQEKSSQQKSSQQKAQTLDLPNTDFKSAILNMLNEQKERLSKNPLETMRMTSHRIENVDKI